MKPEQAAAVIDTDQLPERMREPVTKLLGAYRVYLTTTPDAYQRTPKEVADKVARLLFDIAFYEPDPLPTAETFDKIARRAWPHATNIAYKQALFDLSPTGYGRAVTLRFIREADEQGDEQAAAKWRADLETADAESTKTTKTARRSRTKNTVEEIS